MAQLTESHTYTAFPNQLFDDLVQGKIDNMMFSILVWLYRRANWKSGIASRASSQQIRAELWGGWTYEKNQPSERTIQEKLRRLAAMGYIVSHHTAGRRGTYSISINNYPVLTAAGERLILRPTETKSLDEVLAASCGDSGGESSGESSADPAVSLPRTHSTTLDSPDYHSTSEVSEGVSKEESRASLAPIRSVESKPSYLVRYEELKAKGWTTLINTLHPNAQFDKYDSELEAAITLMDRGYRPKDAENVISWSKSHKSGSKVIRSLSRVLKALYSDSDYSLLKQMQDCEEGSCRICKKLGLGPVRKDEPTPNSASPLPEEAEGSGHAFERQCNEHWLDDHYHPDCAECMEIKADVEARYERSQAETLDSSGKVLDMASELEEDIG